MNRKILAILIMGGLVLVTACQNPMIDENYEAKAVVELANGTVFTFELPPSGSSKIVASRISAPDNGEAAAITVSGRSATAMPYHTFVLDLVPAQTLTDGTQINASATLRVVTYETATPTTPVDSNYHPKTRVFSIEEDDGLTETMYVVPTGKGVFQFEWSTMEPILPVEALTEYSLKSYTLRSVKVVAKTSN